jgi:hypothetical protein
VYELANTYELSVWIDSIPGLMFTKKAVTVEDTDTLSKYKLDYTYINNENIFLVMQGYTLCFKIEELILKHEGTTSKHIVVDHDVVGKSGKIYRYHKNLNDGKGGFCEAVFMS